MKRKRILIAVACILLIGLFAVLCLFRGHKPFKDLQATDIVSAQIKLAPPNKTIQVSNIEELIPYLNNLVVYGKDQSYTEYCGQIVTVTLVTADAKHIEIIENNLFIVIDGVGYKAKYEPCEALNHYANSMAD